MKAINKKTPRRIRKIALLTAVLLLVGCGTYLAVNGVPDWLFHRNTSENTEGNNPPSKEQQETGSSIKEKSLEKEGASGSDTPTPAEEQPDGRKRIEVDIISVQPIESITRVSVMLSILSQNGTCSLEVADASGRTIHTAQSDVQPLSNTSTCKGFDIPNSTLPSSYSIKITYNNNDTYGVATYVK